MLTAWHELFVAAAGAAAALAGLIVVAMSVNIQLIIKFPGLSSRAGATIASIVLALDVSIVALVPISRCSCSAPKFCSARSCCW